jgi:hypothetical protein
VNDARCPDDCQFFVDRTTTERHQRRAGRRARLLGHGRQFMGLFPRFFNWFSGLPSLTQVLVLLLLVWLFVPRLVQPFIDLAKAIQGKSDEKPPSGVSALYRFTRLCTVLEGDLVFDSNPLPPPPSEFVE